ncbi:MAG: DUF1579 domain-containing protein [Planctomycetes bacterium]|jgi:hypothetical protein|nr:DUF1579 domain-containing protein [Planctomycetota bacterium]
MADQDCPQPGPGPQHAWIQSNVGVWDVECSFFMDPSQPPMKVSATDTVTALGPYFVQGQFAAEFFGSPFRGVATLGFDPALQKFVSTWIDTMSPHLYHFTGSLDASGTRLELSGRAPIPGGQQLCDWHSTEEHRADGTRSFEMSFVPPGGKPVRMLSYVYRRR